MQAYRYRSVHMYISVTERLNSLQGGPKKVSQRNLHIRAHCTVIFAIAQLSQVPHWLTYRNLHGFARFPGDSTALVVYRWALSAVAIVLVNGRSNIRHQLQYINMPRLYIYSCIIQRVIRTFMQLMSRIQIRLEQIIHGHFRRFKYYASSLMSRA